MSPAMRSAYHDSFCSCPTAKPNRPTAWADRCSAFQFNEHNLLLSVCSQCTSCSVILHRAHGTYTVVAAQLHAYAISVDNYFMPCAALLVCAYLQAAAVDTLVSDSSAPWFAKYEADWKAVNGIDLTWIQRKLMDEEEGEGWDEVFSHTVLEEYRKFLLLTKVNPSIPVVPSKLVDKVG